MTGSAPEPDKPTPIAIAVVESAGRFLAGPRAAGRPLAGMWEFPGGKVEPGETPGQAAARECFEETGIDVEMVGLYPEQVQQYQHDRVRLQFVACRPKEPAAAAPREPFRWVARHDLASLNFPPGNQRLLELLLSK